MCAYPYIAFELRYHFGESKVEGCQNVDVIVDGGGGVRIEKTKNWVCSFAFKKQKCLRSLKLSSTGTLFVRVLGFLSFTIHTHIYIYIYHTSTFHVPVFEYFFFKRNELELHYE